MKLFLTFALFILLVVNSFMVFFQTDDFNEFDIKYPKPPDRTVTDSTFYKVEGNDLVLYGNTQFDSTYSEKKRWSDLYHIVPPDSIPKFYAIKLLNGDIKIYRRSSSYTEYEFDFPFFFVSDLVHQIIFDGIAGKFKYQNVRTDFFFSSLNILFIILLWPFSVFCYLAFFRLKAGRELSPWNILTNILYIAAGSSLLGIIYLWIPSVIKFILGLLLIAPFILLGLNFFSKKDCLKTMLCLMVSAQYCLLFAILYFNTIKDLNFIFYYFISMLVYMLIALLLGSLWERHIERKSAKKQKVV